MSLPFNFTLINLGRMKYLQALQVQKHIRSKILEGSQHTLLILEHPPVYTLGLRERIEVEESLHLKSLGADVVHSDRGGLSTFHGPGQLVAYPILNLTKLGMTVKEYVGCLERVAINTCRLLGVPAVGSYENVSHTGAWANGNKICAIGIHCKRYVTTHGLALNCNVNLSWFGHIVPCGIKDKGVTSLEKELGEKITVDEALPPLLQSFENIFRCKINRIDKEEELSYQRELN